MKYTFLIAILIGYSYVCSAQAQTKAVKISDKSWQKLLVHPRLFADNAQIKSIKRQKDVVSKQLLTILKSEAEKNLLAEKIVYPTTGFKFGAVRNVQGRILSLALAYRILGDKRYFERAKAELKQLAELPDWCPTHFLDVGEAALAAGIGLDWLYNDLTPDERAKIAQAIVKNALLPSLEAKEKPDNSSWVNGNFNWNPVCNGGLLVAALAIAEREPQLSRQIVERAIKNIPFAGEAYAPDGSFAESPSYWSYGTSFYVMAVEALRTVFGTAYGLDKMDGFLKTADYKNQMVAPTGEDYNYSDYHKERQNEPIMLWFARETGRLDLIKDELTDLNHLSAMKSKGENGSVSRHLPLEILWWQPSLKNKKTAASPLHWTAKGGLPLGVLRSAWDNPNASFIAIKGGTPNNSHGHMDGGSFILEADSVRWAVDLGTESYDKMRAAKLDLWNYSQNSNRWTTFRCGPDGHNILRFNNARQDITGFGTIEKLPDTEGVMGNVLDLSSLYKSQVQKVSRTVKLFPDKSMSIEDAWITGENNVETTFQWLTYAKATVTDYGILLEQNGKSLKLKVEISDAKPIIIIEDVSASKAIQDSPNPNLTRILIKTSSPAHSEGKLSIRVYPNGVKF